MDWQPVRNYEAKYEVSTSGEVRKSDGRLLKQWQNHDGYWMARLSGPRAVARVHRLVAEAFIGNDAAAPLVNHIDNDPSNNSVDNLEWCTQKENLAHARAQKRMPNNYWLGRRSPNAYLSDAQVRIAREMYASGRYSLADVATEFEISKRAIHRLVKRETYADV